MGDKTENVVEVNVTGVSGKIGVEDDVGVAEGLEQACEIIDDMLKKLNEGDE